MRFIEYKKETNTRTIGIIIADKNTMNMKFTGWSMKIK